MKDKIFNFLKNLNLLEIFVLISPLIDTVVAIGINLNNYLSNVGLLIRGIMILVLILYIMKNNSKYKKISIVYLILLFSFCALFLFNKLLISKNPFIFSEIKGIIKFLYFPISFIGVLNLLNEKKECFDDEKLAFTSFIYVIIIILSIIFGFSSNSYSHGKAGLIGIFNSPNEISALFGILTPITFFYLCRYKNKILSLILGFVYIYVLLNIGTKVPLLALFFTQISYIIVVTIQYFVTKNKGLFKKTIMPIIYTIFIFLTLFVFSPITANLKWQSNNIDAMYNVEPVTENEIIGTNDNSKSNKINKIINMILSSRDQYVINKYNIWKDSIVSEKLLGMGSVDEDGVQNTVEIDMFDVFFNYGIVGFIIYFSVIVLFIVYVVYLYFKNFKNLITDDKIQSMVISVILGFGISLIAGHVISSPSTSLMLALVFSIITNYLIGKYSNKKDTKMNNLINLYNRKPLYACLLVIALSCFVVPFMYTYDKNNPKFYVSSQNININDIKDINGLNLINSSNYKINNIEDTIYNYKFNENKIKLDINIIDRCFDNDTCVKFLNINNNSDKKIYININLSDSKYDSTFDFKPYERERSISPELGNDYLRLPITYMENKDSSILIGKTYQYKYLDTNDEKVVLKEIIFEDNDLKYIDNSYIKTIRINSNSSIDTYFFTGDKLFNDKKSIEKYIKLINEGKTSPWISYDGTYSKIKKTIFPYSEKSYGKDLIENTENEIVDILNKNNSKLFYDLVTMTNIYFEKYMDKNNQNIWNTNYKDIILKDKYDIDSTYIDINKNIQVGLYYKKLGEYLKDNEIKMKYQNLSKYLVNQYNYGNIISVEDGILFSDYMMDNQNIRTDISLDCQLSIIQYLLTSYYDTYNYKYYSLAKKLLNTIENMNQKWISKNKNIYSTLNVDNSFTVEDRGFDLLMKLIDIQDYLSETSIGKSDVLNDFIKSKIEYIKAYKLEIPKDLKKKLKAGGYIE